jgi:hypothetical protein
MKSARWEWLCRSGQETFLLDRHEAMKDCIELIDHATANAVQPEGVTISIVRHAL